MTILEKARTTVVQEAAALLLEFKNLLESDYTGRSGPIGPAGPLLDRIEKCLQSLEDVT